MTQAGASPAPFAGIDAPNTTPVPDVYFDVLFPQLGKGPLKVLLYLVRRIFGFKKDGDTVSLSQICEGIRRRDGTALDRGTGLSRQAATRAVRELEALGVIVARRDISPRGDPAPTFYALRFREQLSVQDLLRSSPAQAGYRFPGIDSPNTTPVPDSYFDLLLPVLGLAEWQVLLYVVRRTLGFKKLSDAISVDQFTRGITTQAGMRLDAGTGLSRSNVHEALNRLVMRNVLTRRRVQDTRTGDGVSIFSLTMRDEVRAAMGQDLGLAPGPLLEAAAGTAALRVLPMDYPGVPQRDHTGVLQTNHLGVRQQDYPGVLGPYHPGPEPHQRDAPGVLHMDHQGVLRGHYPPVPPPTLPGSRNATARGAGSHPPVGGAQDPQQTDPQQTDPYKERGGNVGTYDAIVRQVADDLGLPSLAPRYASRVDQFAVTCGLPAPDFLDALLAAWRLTRTKLHGGALDRRDAALSYFYSTLTDLATPTAIRQPLPPGAAAPTVGVQDPQFLVHAAEQLGDLPDQAPWCAVLTALAGGMTRTNYSRWFARSALVATASGLTVAVADALQRDWLSTRLAAVIRRAAEECGESRPALFATVDDLRGRDALLR